jgi:phosphoserine phosphatase RsbU/P
VKRPNERERSTILVVDDEAGILRAASRILGREHYVVTTASPHEAIELVQESRPEIAILDILLPEMNGFELMGQIKKARKDVDVIVMTGNPYELDNNLIRAIEEGAFYFLQKPFDRRVLLTLVGRCLELRHLRRQREQHVANLERELRAAKVFQQSLLPPEENALANISIAARYLACDELAGDLYDYITLDDDAVALIVADVSGHGTHAAMLTGIVKSAFHAAHVHRYDPTAVMNCIADSLRTFEASRFVTAFAARIDDSSLTFASGGHTPGLLLSPNAAPRLLSSTGPLISSGIPEAEWESVTIPFEPHQQLLLYTDGVTEARSSQGMFGQDRLIDAAARMSNRGRLLIDALLSELRTFTDQRPLTDDLTLFVAERIPAPAPKPKTATALGG